MVAWDDGILDIHVIAFGDEYIHCRVTVRAKHVNVVIYYYSWC